MVAVNIESESPDRIPDTESCQQECSKNYRKQNISHSSDRELPWRFLSQRHGSYSLMAAYFNGVSSNRQCIAIDVHLKYFRFHQLSCYQVSLVIPRFSRCLIKRCRARKIRCRACIPVIPRSCAISAGVCSFTR